MENNAHIKQQGNSQKNVVDDFNKPSCLYCPDSESLKEQIPAVVQLFLMRKSYTIWNSKE